MESLISFIKAMQLVKFDGQTVTVRNQQRKIYHYTVDEFFKKVIPAWENTQKGQSK